MSSAYKIKLTSGLHISHRFPDIGLASQSRKPPHPSLSPAIKKPGPLQISPPKNFSRLVTIHSRHRRLRQTDRQTDNIIMTIAVMGKSQIKSHSGITNHLTNRFKSLCQITNQIKSRCQPTMMSTK